MSPLDDDQFDALEDQVDALAKQASAPSQPHHDRHHHFDPVHNEADFEQLVSEALDGLPDDIQKQLGNTAVVVSDRGAEAGAYGLFRGYSGTGNSSGLGADFFGGPPDEPEILIFRDTLVRDYGHDPQLLRAQVRKTVRHEVGHALGFDEAGVTRLGLG
jgi:predicted Zn-dependent protease with MMP-like domain